MLTFYGCGIKGTIIVDRDAAFPASITWIDAFEPTEQDMALLAHTMGVRVPSRQDLEEVETSSRLATEGETLIMSLPAMLKDETGYPVSTPVGLVLSSDKLLTIRFARLPSFTNLTQRIDDKGDLPPGGIGAAISLLEIIVDDLADVLEGVGTVLDAISRDIFASRQLTTGERRPQDATAQLRQTLQAVGRNGDLVSKASESLLGVSRITQFLARKGAILLISDSKTLLETIGQDAKSLNDFKEHLTNRTQFLLDTLLGFANIEQNNIFRVLTVVSVVGIPPTFFASMYGMNFKTIPEYEWSHGYAYALTLIACSAIIPAAWFKFKGWW